MDIEHQDFNVNTIEEAKLILSKVSFAPSCVDMGWEFEVQDDIQNNEFRIRTTFQRPDTRTGEISRGYGRWMVTPKPATPAGLVKTAWLCAELIVKHELMEAFLYKGVRIFNPHKTLKHLAYPKELPTF